MKPIEEIVPRQTAEQQFAFIQQAWFSAKEETNVDKESIDELDPTVDDDIPF